jgi:hypothetical protein
VIFKRKPRIAVVNLFVAVDAEAAGAVRDTVLSATKRIVDSEGDFDVTKTAVERVVRALLDKPDAWTHAACGGEVFDNEADADTYGSECFADFSSRYLAGEDKESRPEAKSARPGDDRIVVMLTLAYRGENAALEQQINDRIPLEDALKAILALIVADRVELAHIHVSPAQPGDHLDDERMLVNFPELLSL